MFNAKARIGFILALGVILPSATLANVAPVVDLTQLGYPPDTSGDVNESPDQNNNGKSPIPPVDASTLPLPDRINRVEQQVNNLVQMNMPQQIAELQQQVQQLNGQLQELAHNQDIASRQQQHVEALPATPPPAQTPPNQAILNAANAPPNDATPPSAPPPTDSVAYEKAFSLLSEKQYDQAAVAFKDYLLKHPNGQFVANAHYWLGDIYFQLKNYTQAEMELNLVITQYAASGKVADAQFKLANLHAIQGKTEQARQELKNIMLRFPGTSAAQLASIQLQQLNAAPAPGH
jgi:tol-pal system protein YbgF